MTEFSKTPTTEEQLAAVTVGTRQPHNGPIELHPYDATWPVLFQALEKELRVALGAQVLLLEHVGSTSVPGLSAKPVIDLVMEVADSTDEGAYVSPLEKLGYALRIREPDWFQHRLLKCPAVSGNLHVFSHGCEETRRMLTFRDWLRAQEHDRQLYESAKKALARQTWKHVQHYADAKSGIIREILGRATALS